MNKEEITQHLGHLNEELRSMNVKGELCLYGGVVMCLAYDARPSTKDVDAVFRPAQQIRRAAERVASASRLRSDWLNDAVKGFVPHAQKIFLNLSHLKVYIPEPDYLLAMKTLAARVDGTDKKDIEFLVKVLGLSRADEVLGVLEKYYPQNQIKRATRYFIEELFDSWSRSVS